ncbi:Detected protein of unknown function [Hibiscus syriacus]|uniref:Uncharacterized protein n=1 Tax=Hibiscus syriacus TaxID=106335 RepID=A0A6A3CAC9_HIBSY|nr:Detected protein of unknown function [Hibiscus syriacus]
MCLSFVLQNLKNLSKRLGGVRNYSVLRNDQLRIKEVNDVIDVASGKGGVGKSTTAVNLVVSLANWCGLKVGVLDADVYGPSVPTMMNIHQKAEVNKGSFDLLGHTAPVQAASLLLSGPFVDYWLTEKKVYAYNYTAISMFFIILSCTIAVGTNLSQFICIGRFTVVSSKCLAI